MANIRFSLPPLSEQQSVVEAIDQAVSPIDQALDKIEKSVERLRERRAALITAAVTGQIDVAAWGKRRTTDRLLDDMEAEMAGAAPPEHEKVRA